MARARNRVKLLAQCMGRIGLQLELWAMSNVRSGVRLWFRVIVRSGSCLW